MAVIEDGGGTTGRADVTLTNDLQVRTPIVKENAGFVGLAGIVDDGANYANVPRVNRIYVTESQKLAVGINTVLADDDFGSTAQNTARYKAPTTTQTVTYAGGFVILNGSNITTINTNSAYQSYRYFSLFGDSELRCTMIAQLVVVPQNNATTEFGLFSATLPGSAAPLDGVFFRYNSSGELRGVISYAGTETQTAAITPPSVSNTHKYRIITQNDNVLFYIDNVLVGKLTMLTDAPGYGQPMSASTQPFTMRHYIGGTAPAIANQFKLTSLTIEHLGSDLSKPWAQQKALAGLSAYQGQNGMAMGSTALFSNSLAAGAGAVLTNTTAALGVGLGGQFSGQPTLAGPTDGIICSYLNPVPSTAIEGRILVITDVEIMSVVTTALTGGPLIMAYSLAFGHTALSLATTESATAKAPRRIALGFEVIAATAAVGTLGSQSGLAQEFNSPVVIQPGEYIALAMKNLGTVTSAGVVTWHVTFHGFWE